MTPEQAERYFMARHFVAKGDHGAYCWIPMPDGTSLEAFDIAELRRKFDAAIAKG